MSAKRETCPLCGENLFISRTETIRYTRVFPHRRTVVHRDVEYAVCCESFDCRFYVPHIRTFREAQKTANRRAK